MARMTKAEKEAQARQEQERLEAAHREQYLPRLMSAMEDATKKNNYELTVTDGLFSLRDRDGYDSRNELTFLSPVYTENNWVTLERLEWDLHWKTQQREEAERRRLAKVAALNKLTAEERELLGLK